MYRQQLPRQHRSQNQIVAVQGTGVCVCEMSCHTPVDGMVDDRVKGLLHIISETVDDSKKIPETAPASTSVYLPLASVFFRRVPLSTWQIFLSLCIAEITGGLKVQYQR